jgi:hypothetical protein
MPQDRTTLIRLASTLPVGNELRRAILTAMSAKGHPIFVRIFQEVAKKWNAANPGNNWAKDVEIGYAPERASIRYFNHVLLFLSVELDKTGKNIVDGPNVFADTQHRYLLGGQYRNKQVQDWRVAADAVWKALGHWAKNPDKPRNPKAAPPAEVKTKAAPPAEAKTIPSSVFKDVESLALSVGSRWSWRDPEVKTVKDTVNLEVWGEDRDHKAGGYQDEYDSYAAFMFQYQLDLDIRGNVHDGIMKDLKYQLERQRLDPYVTRIESDGVPTDSEVYIFRIHLRP